MFEDWFLYFIYLFVFSLHVSENGHSGFFSVFEKHTKKSMNSPKHMELCNNLYLIIIE